MVFYDIISKAGMIVLIIVLEVLMCGLATTLLTGMDNTRMRQKQSAKDKIYHSVSSHQEAFKDVRLENKITVWNEETQQYQLVEKNNPVKGFFFIFGAPD